MPPATGSLTKPTKPDSWRSYENSCFPVLHSGFAFGRLFQRHHPRNWPGQGQPASWPTVSFFVGRPGCTADSIEAHIQDTFSVARDAYYYGLSQQKQGQTARAVDLLTQARDLWRQIGLEVYADYAQQALHELNSPPA